MKLSYGAKLGRAPTGKSIRARIAVFHHAVVSFCLRFRHTPCCMKAMDNASEPLPVSSILAKISARPEKIAAALNVSSSTVSRWIAGSARPRPTQEAKLRRLLAEQEIDAGSLFTQAMSAQAEQELREALVLVLKEVRETLHRIGRFSSRHEALDEVAKLLFAHFVDLRNGGAGISSSLIEEDATARKLVRYTSEVFFRFLPAAAAHHAPPSAFTLKLNEGDERFAQQMVAAFDAVNTPAIRQCINGAHGVDILNDTFGSFLADSFVEEKELGQYLTPTEVVHFMVSSALTLLTSEERQMLRAPSGHDDFGFILDPSCGVGSLLAETVKQAIHLVPNDDVTRSNWTESAARKLIVGIDKSERMFRLATCNLGLFGFPVAHLYLANGLARGGNPSSEMINMEGKVRLILTNPPFGASFPVASLGEYSSPTWMGGSRFATIDSEILFLERYLDWLMPGGRVVAVVPDSILTNKGMYAALREYLSKKASIEFVISLPHVTFASAGTSTKTSLLCLQKQVSPKATRSFYAAVCRNIGFDVVTRGSVRRKVKSSKCDLPDILGEVSSRKNTVVGTWLSTQPTVERWDASFHHSTARVDEGSEKPRVKLSTLATVVNERENPKRRGSGTFSYIEISDVEAETATVGAKTIPCDAAPSRARKRVKAGDVLISTVRPDRKSIGVVPSHLDGAICSTGFAALRPIAIHSLLLAKLMMTDEVTSQLCAHSSGVAYPVFDEAILPTLEIPSINSSLDTLNRLAASADDAMKTARRALDLLNDAISAALPADTKSIANPTPEKCQ